MGHPVLARAKLWLCADGFTEFDFEEAVALRWLPGKGGKTLKFEMLAAMRLKGTTPDTGVQLCTESIQQRDPLSIRDPKLTNGCRDMFHVRRQVYLEHSR